MEIKYQFCFETGAVSKNDCIYFFENFVNFIPDRVTINNKTKKFEFIDSKILMSLQWALDKRIFIEDSNGNYIGIGNAETSTPFFSITLNQEVNNTLLMNNNLDFLLERKGLISAYILNSDYEAVQSQKFSNNLLRKSYPKEILESIANTPYSEDVWGNRLNTKFNPGRSKLLSNTWLMVGYEMWFGESFFTIVPKSKLLAFTDAISVRESISGNVYVNLWERIEEPYTIDAMDRQWKWRNWLDYDQLENTYG